MSYQKLLSARVALAALLATTQELGHSRELSLAVTNIQSCRMLLGSVAGMMGAPSPYPQGDNPASPEIRPQSDMPSGEPAYVVPSDPVVAVKMVRSLAEESIQNLLRIRTQLWPKRYGNSEESLFEAALVDLHRAKAFLGEQLAVIAGHPLVRRGPEKVMMTVGGNRAGKSALAEVVVIHEIRRRLLANEPITEICRALDVTEYRVLQVREQMTPGVEAAPPVPAATVSEPEAPTPAAAPVTV